jgi:hypothetical protein
MEEERRSSTPERTYEEQRRLEEDLLAVGPGEEDPANSKLDPDLLDVSMEDTDARTKVPNEANPITGASHTANQNSGAGAANPPMGAMGAMGAANPPMGAMGEGSGLATSSPTTRNGSMLGASKSISGGGRDDNSKNPIEGPPRQSNIIRMYEMAKKAGKITPVPDLYGGASAILPPVGTLLREGDIRYQNLTIVSDTATGINTSYSFDPEKMSCICCGKFPLRTGGGGGSGLVFHRPEFSPLNPLRGKKHAMPKNYQNRGVRLITHG